MSRRDGTQRVSDSKATIAPALAAALRRALPDVTGIAALHRLSGGANQETWAFDAEHDGDPLPLVLRRTPGGGAHPGFGTSVPLATEAHVIGLAGQVGVPVPGAFGVIAGICALAGLAAEEDLLVRAGQALPIS